MLKSFKSLFLAIALVNSCQSLRANFFTDVSLRLASIVGKPLAAVPRSKSFKVLTSVAGLALFIHALAEVSAGLTDKIGSKKTRAKKPGFLTRLNSWGTKKTNGLKLAILVLLSLGAKYKRRPVERDCGLSLPAFCSSDVPAAGYFGVRGVPGLNQGGAEFSRYAAGETQSSWSHGEVQRLSVPSDLRRGESPVVSRGVGSAEPSSRRRQTRSQMIIEALHALPIYACSFASNWYEAVFGPLEL